MRSRHLLLLSCLVLTSSLQAALSPSQTAARRTLAVGGVPCPEVSLWSGGDPSGTVVEVKAGSGASPSKHLGAIRYEPIVLQASLPFSQPLLDCVADLCASRHRPVTLQLGAVDNNSGAIGDVLQATDAVLTQVQFAPLDATASKSPTLATLTFQASATQVVANGAGISQPGVPTGKGTRASGQHFRITLAGLTTNTVKQVEAITIRRSAPDTSSLSGRAPSLAAPSAQFSNVVLTLARSPAPRDWLEWQQSFLVKGNNSDAFERAGAIEWLTADLKTVVFSMQLSQVGLVRLLEVADDAGSVITPRAELYMERITVSNGPAAPVAATTPETSDKPVVNNPVGTADTAKTPTPKDATPAAAAPAVSNPEDQGMRDPADFPRPDGTVRTLFTSVRQKGSLQETAKYTAKQTVAQVMEFYEKNLGGNGWEEGTRYENNYGAGGAHQIQTTWTKDNRTASLSIVDLGKGSSELQVIVQAKF